MFKNICFEEHLQTAASVDYMLIHLLRLQLLAPFKGAWVTHIEECIVQN